MNIKRMVLLNSEGFIIDHRPVGHIDVTDEWVEVNYSQFYTKMTLNELIENRCGVVVNGSLHARAANPMPKEVVTDEEAFQYILRQMITPEQIALVKAEMKNKIESEKDEKDKE